MTDYSKEAMRFAASVMGNPEYLKAVKDVRCAKDQRREGIEKLNSFHKHHCDERLKKEKEKEKK